MTGLAQDNLCHRITIFTYIITTNCVCACVAIAFHEIYMLCTYGVIQFPILCLFIPIRNSYHLNLNSYSKHPYLVSDSCSFNAYQSHTYLYIIFINKNYNVCFLLIQILYLTMFIFYFFAYILDFRQSNWHDCLCWSNVHL